MKVYIENCTLGEKSTIKVNQIIYQFKSQSKVYEISNNI